MKIGDLPQATTVSEEDVFPIVQGGQTKKLPKKILKIVNDVIIENGFIYLVVGNQKIGIGAKLPNSIVDETVSQVKIDVARHETILNGYSEINITHLDLPKYEQVIGYPNNNGTWSGSAKYKSVIIPIPTTDCSFEMTANASSGLMYCGFKTFEKTGENVANFEFSNADEWKQRWTLVSNLSVTKSIADDVKYILLVTLNNDIDATPSNLKIFKEKQKGLVDDVDTIKNDIIKIQEDLENVNGGQGGTPDDNEPESGTIEQLQQDVARHESILNGSGNISITDLSVYEQIVGLPNQKGAAANWVIKDTYKHIVIPVPETGCKLRMTANADSNLMYCGLKSYTQPTAATSPIEFSDDADWNMRWSLIYNTSVEKDIADDINYILLVTLNNGVDAYPTSFEIYKEGSTGLVGEVNKIKGATRPLAGKTLFAFGDSITYGYITIDGVRQDVRYTEVIKEKLGCNIENFGSSGAATGRLCTIMTGGVVDRKSDVDPSQPTLCYDYSNADIVTIMIGTNNGIYVGGIASTFDDIPKIYGATVKTIADGGTIEYNGQTISTTDDYWALFPNSFHGNLALCIEWVMWKKPDAKIYLIIPPYNNISDWRNFTHTEVRPALFEIGAYYGVEVIDPQVNSGINLHNLLDYTFDGVHFNQDGCKKWGNYIAGQIKVNG